MSLAPAAWQSTSCALSCSRSGSLAGHRVRSSRRGEAAFLELLPVPLRYTLLIQSGDQKLVTKLKVVCAEGLSDARDQHAETRQRAPGSQSHPGPLGPQRLGRNGAERLAPAYREQAMKRAVGLKPVLSELQAQGLSARGIAGELNRRAVPTPAGGQCHAQTVIRTLQRIMV
jgi:hypothetical protein